MAQLQERADTATQPDILCAVAPQLDLRIDRRAGVPIGTQLTARIRAALREGSLAPGDQLPSVRAVAEAAGVNVNTARSVYARLESEGLVRSEQGRGTFATGEPPDEVATRRELHRQIAQLEAALTRLPPPALRDAPSRAAPALLSTEGLEQVRDELLARLEELDAQRAEVLQRLEQLGVEERAPRRATPSRAGARIRWVGA
jgi:DNA-binding transcriptional regulator YhcF (GntR family)